MNFTNFSLKETRASKAWHSVVPQAIHWRAYQTIMSSVESPSRLYTIRFRRHGSRGEFRNHSQNPHNCSSLTIAQAVGQICSTSSMSHNLAQCRTVVQKAVAAGAKVESHEHSQTPQFLLNAPQDRHSSFPKRATISAHLPRNLSHSANQPTNLHFC